MHKKAVLMELLAQKLQGKGGFKLTPTGEPGALAGVPTPSPDPRDQTSEFAEELQFTLRIKEVEVRHSELQVEVMHLKVKALELEWEVA